jgi:peptide/nickel transport system permease protein
VLIYIARRLLLLIPLLLLVSLLAFLIIQLPPGDFVDTYVRNLQDQGGSVNAAQIHALRQQYGLDQPWPVQYLLWIKGIIFEGDFGNSFVYKRPVAAILMERVPRTIFISLASIALTWIVAVPMGILSAVKQYSVWDYSFTFLTFVGLAVPGFLLALVLMLAVYHGTGFLITGLFSPDFRDAPWSFAKFLDLLKNIWLPLLVLVITNVAGVVRVLRASLLDELGKQYVTTARAKGLTERRVLIRYPVRLALSPLISTIGWVLPATVGGEVVVSKVLNLPTVGPILLQSILSQDMYLTGAIVLILSALTIFGTVVSDVLLAVADPRIRYGKAA